MLNEKDKDKKIPVDDDDDEIEQKPKTTGILSGFQQRMKEKYEAFRKFYEKHDNIDFITDLSAFDIADTNLIETYHYYFLDSWGYKSPLLNHVERYKHKRVSFNRLGRGEATTIMKADDEEEKKKTMMDRLTGVV